MDVDSHAHASDAVLRGSLSEQIYNRLRLGLMTGVYEPGERLNIRQMAKAFETSPTPVREATMQLVREGALELRLGHQLRVPSMNVDGYLEVRDIRLPLERFAAERAATLMTPEEMLNLQYQARRCADAEDAGFWKEALAANQKFHFVIYAAARSGVLVRVIENLWLLTGPFINHLYPIGSGHYHSAEGHGRILEALQQRDSRGAGDAVAYDIVQGSAAIVAQVELHRKGGSEKPGRMPKRNN